MGKAEQTRARILREAERLFAERGIEAVSLREIGLAAGQRNNSVTRYHFGTRQGLVDAIFALRMAPIDERRQVMLDEIAASGRTTDVRALSEALILPLVFALDDQQSYGHYARFLAQVISVPDFEILSDRTAGVTGGLRRLTAWLDAALPGLPRTVRAERISLAGGFVVHSLADRERAGPERTTTSPALFAANLVDATVGLLRAPMLAATRRALHTTTERSA